MTRKTHDLAVKTGSYELNGETKGRWMNVGALMEDNDGRPFLMLNACFNPAGIQREEGGSWAHEERLGKKARDTRIPAQNAAVESATARSMIRASGGGGKKAVPPPVPDEHAQRVLFTAQAVRKASKKSGRS